jgi:penicillin-insensitive murein endopeptidase
MVDRAARAVAKRYPGTVLYVGDISRRRGGEIAGHRSHESGRDADLGFYVFNAGGKQVQAQAFIPFDGSLRSASAPGARFDLARNWLLIERLMADPEARVTHIFVAAPLRQRLLEFARSQGVPGRVITRAAMVMMQPTRAMAHDNHFHVRIACPASMRGKCVEIAKNAPRGGRAVVLANKKPRGNPQAYRVPRKKVEPSNRPKTAGAKPMNLAPLRAQAEMLDSRESMLESTGALDVDSEAESDGADVKDAVDDSGTAKITD